jgi:hypothetical protein
MGSMKPPAASATRITGPAYTGSMKPPVLSATRITGPTYIGRMKPPAVSATRITGPTYTGRMKPPAVSATRTPVRTYVGTTKPPAGSATRIAGPTYIDTTSTAKNSDAIINTQPTPAKAAPSSSTKSTVNAAMPMSKHEAYWEEKCHLLKLFKTEFGSCDFQALTAHSYGKYKGLDKWVRTARVPAFFAFYSTRLFSHRLCVFVFFEGKVPA